MIDQLVAEFGGALRVRYEPPPLLKEHASQLIAEVGEQNLVSADQRRSNLFADVRRKFRLNTESLQAFLTLAATNKLVFNYHEKNEIAAAFDHADKAALIAFLDTIKTGELTSDLQSALIDAFRPISVNTTLDHLHRELVHPTLTRRDSKPRDWSAQILASLFSAFVYSSFPEPLIHDVTDPLSDKQHYEPDFWLHLHRNLPALFSRTNTLSIVRVSNELLMRHMPYEGFRELLLSAVRNVHGELSNHGFLAILLDLSGAGSHSLRWNLFADIVLYAEKHIATKHIQPFFRVDHVRRATMEHISQLNAEAADFSVLNSGYSYQDCFVFGQADQLLMLLQKHQPDETLIPCPTCRSHKVQGNSYSSLGVRSWECDNQLCPDRSKFNRGKRYSFLQLLKQRAIQESENLLSSESIKRWSRDVQRPTESNEILRMLIDHYSLAGDCVHLFCWPRPYPTYRSRSIRERSLDDVALCPKAANSLSPEEFPNASYFQRFCVDKPIPRSRRKPAAVELGGLRAYNGDAFEVLCSLDEACIDGAVTSPPYYNAREYSRWENIYAYLYDMYNINRAVFRVLRPGATYLYNIFDYFDNERNVSLSAMGEKRMILGAYTIDLFRRIGFECRGNIVWDKGEIEGKRAFNGGNRSPYYQAPFNCWEHILVFEKPGCASAERPRFPSVIKLRPVFKMVRGENVHGHTAPFPELLPGILVDTLKRGSTVLDPFAGSMTTAIAALKGGCSAICVEKSPEYFELGLRKVKDSLRQVALF